MKTIFSFFIFLLIYSCSEQTVQSTVSGNQTGQGTAIPGTGTNLACTGTAADGADPLDDPTTQNALPLQVYDMNVAGTSREDSLAGNNRSWQIGNDAQTNNQNSELAVQASLNDGPVYLRLFLKPQPRTQRNVRTCAGEDFISPDSSNIPYQKVSVRVEATVYAVAFGANREVLGTPEEVLPTAHYVTTVDSLSVNSCSNIIKINPILVNVSNDSQGRTREPVTVFRVTSFLSDTGCQICNSPDLFPDLMCTGDTVEGKRQREVYCPVGGDIRDSECLSMKVQVATSKTVFFKGASRY